MTEHQTRRERNKKKKTKRMLKKEKRSQRHWFARGLFFTGRFMRRGVLVGLLLLSIGVTAGIYYYQKNLEPMVSEYIREGYEIADTIDPSHFQPLEPTVLLDGNGDEIRVFKDRNYFHLDLQIDDDLYERVANITTVIEDDRFYQHKGFDYLGVGVAVFDYVARGSDLRGASTLTQQLVKNKYLSQEQTMARKITEAVIAQELEDQFSKREILEFYVNDAYFGRGNYGLETASRYYFGKSTEDLVYRELASLIAIPNNPTVYDPVTNPDNTISRRNLVLRLLADKGLITEEERLNESKKGLELTITPMVINNQLYDWAESFAVNRAVEEVMRWEGFQFEYWHETDDERATYREHYNNTYHRHLENVLRGGYVIETSIQPDMQIALQSHIDQQMSPFTAVSDEGVLTKQAPSVVIDNQTNEVVAIVGGRSQETRTSFNRAFQAAKQPGSAIKPFLTYAPAYESGMATGTIKNDAPIKDGPGNHYTGYRGNMTLRTALVDSVNTIAYNVLHEIGLPYARQKLVDMEFSNLRPDDRYPTMAIGGWTQGTSPLDLATAFNTLANDGLYYRPHNVRRVSSSQHGAVYFDRAELEPTRVYDSGVGYVTLNTMQSVMQEGTGGRYSFDYKYEAGKTGTTNDVRELWFVGGTPYYSMALYVGDDNPAGQVRSQIDPVIQTIFREFMRDIHLGKTVKDFERPKTVVENGGNMWVRTTQDINPLADSQASEQARKATIKQKQNDRLDTLAYRIEHGLTLEQAEGRERVAMSRVVTLEDYNLGSSEDMSDAEELRERAEKAIEEVVREEHKSPLTLRMNSAYQAIERTKRTTIANRERAEKDEKARIERELLEAERQERLEREREAEEAREAERAVQEEAEREQERLDEINRLEEVERLEEEERVEQERKEQEERANPMPIENVDETGNNVSGSGGELDEPEEGDSEPVDTQDNSDNTID